MADDRRRIATVLAAEVAGHARLAASTDPQTHQALQALRQTLLACIDKHGGRCFGGQTERLTAEFAHAADAVRCAVEAQRTIHRNEEASLPTSTPRVRIGLSVGDVHEIDGNLEGEGVDLALQVQALAVPGGICLAGSVYEHVRHRVHVGFDFAGERRLKGMPDPVALYQVVERGVERGFFSLREELKRRDVFRVGAAYAVVAWLLIQAASIVFPTFDTPQWALQVLISVAILGFPVVLVLAWLYEITPMGLRRSDEVLQEASLREATEKRLNGVIIGLLVVAVVFLIVENYVLPRTGNDGETLDSIAVLAFENFSTDPGDEYFADGLADELLSVLGRIRELKVASRTASFYFKGRDIDVATIASTLRVGYVLSGGVRRYGDRIRVTAALDDPSSSDLIWSESYDRELADILEIQSDIARAVATAIVPVLSERSERQFAVQPTDSTEAYDFYLRGRDYLRQPAEEAILASAVQLFERAIGLDAGFAQAYAGLCEAHLADYHLRERSDSFARAERACNRALTLDDSLWEVHVALGNLYRYSGRYDGAVRELESAVAAQPSAVSSYLALAQTYAAQNLVVEAEAMFRRAEEVESGYWAVHNEFGSFLWHVYRYEEAIPYYQRVIELVPDSGIGHDNLGVTYQALGKFAEAERTFNESPLPSRWTYTNRGLNYYYLGDFPAAVEDQKRAIEIAPDVHEPWGRLGDAYRFIPNARADAQAAYEQAIELAEGDLDINPADWDTLARLCTYYAYSGQPDRAADGLERLFELTDDPTAHYFAALTNLELGNRERVYDHLAVVVASGWSRATVAADPSFAVLHGEARFRELVFASDGQGYPGR